MPLQILYEDNHLIAVNKHSGVLVQGDHTGDVPLLDQLKSYIKSKYHKPGNVFLGTIHRIDRPASGIVIFAKTSKALKRMNEIWKRREIVKSYLIICDSEHLIPSGELIHYLIKNRTKNKSFVSETPKKGWKKAILRFETIADIDHKCLIEVDLQTGRPHQIRAQFSFIGMPLIGDLKYGAHAPMKDGSICLHAWRLSFIHPVSKEKISLEAHPPANFPWLHFKDFV